jgi:hypothetical protein
MTHLSGKPTNQDLASQNVPTGLLTRNNFRLARDPGTIAKVGELPTSQFNPISGSPGPAARALQWVVYKNDTFDRAKGSCRFVPSAVVASRTRIWWLRVRQGGDQWCEDLRPDYVE